LTDEELTAELARLRRHVFDLRAQAVTEKLEDPSMITIAKRDIARILTIQKQRQTPSNRPAKTPTTDGTDA